ncbi:Uncharacterized protein OS=Lentisphaera araneosa HTCC2155 GN=LNTAR_07854 PE=4 SV=1: HXXSHH [Gemmataceae bacterium]|nr:Uncharacterized protein OS=Lentisphaera araneosa HTCC2155 GN=LNTAR_07854 PE=4 SV=1: HXXSHH [Gemmataceae bacterium]VTU02580.1 Uncharacterized protein OS=Lentisphaera araneosa HTCC2155 GN=LNTAR_07854 PE=4 SV=1: HXXSHH [Gemmataceae bacterium]
MSKVISRRTLLRGAAGAALPLPLLNAMGAAPERTGAPLRFVALFKPNGVHPPSWNIEGGTERDFRLSPMMAPLADHKADLLFVDNMGASGFSGHGTSVQRFLSGRVAAGRRDGVASVDQLIAGAVASGTRHRSLELTTEGVFTQAPVCSYISYGPRGEPVPRESDPQLVFDRLFRDPLVSPAQRRDAASLLDRVGDNAKGLAKRLGAEDRRTLEQYLSAVRETERKIEAFDRSPVLKGDPATFPRPATPKDLNEQVERMLDVLALALWTDSTRCATFMLGNDNSRMVFDFLGVKKEHHYLSHYFRNFSRANLDDLYKVCRWHTEKFAGLVKRLKGYAEGDARLLDHTVVLFGAGMGESDAHTGQRIPTVLAGATGRLKTGRYVRPEHHTDLAHLHRALLDTFGVSVPAGHPLAEHAPLAGLDGGAFKPYREVPFESSVELAEGRVTVQGRLRFSDDLDQANQFFIDVKGEPQPVRLQVPFKTFEQHNLPYYCGSPVRVVGRGERKGGEVVVTQVTELRSLIGLKPGAAGRE